MKLRPLPVVVGAIALVGLMWMVGGADEIDFDPKVVGAAETRMWKAYYAKNKVELGRELLTLQQDQFGLNPMVALNIAEPMARGASIFSSSRSDYDAKVLPHLIEGYQRLKAAVGGDWDPEKAARAELSWWVARRTPGQDSVDNVGKCIADLYAELYGSRNPQIEEAARMRAEAAERRDRESQSGVPDWAAIERTLIASYALLRAGVNDG